MSLLSSELEEILLKPAPIAAKELVGCLIERTYPGGTKALVKIVETEAYEQTDVASHSYNGQTIRNEVMFGPPGRLYVYFTYGMHYCCNIVVAESGYGAAILIRAVEPINGYEHMSKFRKTSKTKDISNGPAKLCQALNIDKSMNGHDLARSPFKLIYSPNNEEVQESTRIGISKGMDKKWRYYLASNMFVSRTS